MASSDVLREVTLTIPMLADMEIAASKTATAIAEYMDMSPDRQDELRMAVVEACINAFEHSEADDRRVEIHFTILGDGEPEKLQVTVRDNGAGFAPDEVEEPEIADKLGAASKRGWGLKIIKGLMDEVEIRSSEEGTVVIMSKLR